MRQFPNATRRAPAGRQVERLYGRPAPCVHRLAMTPGGGAAHRLRCPPTHRRCHRSRSSPRGRDWRQSQRGRFSPLETPTVGECLRRMRFLGPGRTAARQRAGTGNGCLASCGTPNSAPQPCLDMRRRTSFGATSSPASSVPTRRRRLMPIFSISRSNTGPRDIGAASLGTSSELVCVRRQLRRCRRIDRRIFGHARSQDWPSTRGAVYRRNAPVELSRVA